MDAASPNVRCTAERSSDRHGSALTFRFCTRFTKFGLAETPLRLPWADARATGSAAVAGSERSPGRRTATGDGRPA